MPMDIVIISISPPYNYRPEGVKYPDLVESHKTNKEIKGLPKYIGEHILPILENNGEQIIKRVLEILSIKYGRI